MRATAHASAALSRARRASGPTVRRPRVGLPAACLLAFGLMARTGFAADPRVPPSEGPAPAEDQRVVALNDEGSALYAAGDYRRAVERFLQAYAVDEDPNLLFNIASCYEALGDIDAALEKYRAFLAADNAEPEGRPRAEQAIARLVALDAPPAEPSSQQAVVASPVPAPQAPVGAVADTGGTNAPWVPWAGLAGGVALGAVGATFYLLGAADHSEVTDAVGFDDPDTVADISRGRANDLVRSGDTKKAIGAASASVGVVLVAGSIVWWLVDPLKSSPSNEGLDLTLDRSQSGIRYRGVF